MRKQFLLIVFFISIKLGAQNYYVANNGKDSNPGSLSLPFKSIDTALKAIHNKNGTIFFRAGIYPITGSIVILKSSNNIALSNYGNETVNFIGGVKLDNAVFQKVTDQKILNRLPVNARSQVYVADLTGISDFGVMKLNGNGTTRLPAALELFYNNLPLTIARWPNDSLLPIVKVLQMQKTATADPAFTYDHNRPVGWAASTDKWIDGIFAVGYADNNIQLDSINTKAKILYLKSEPAYGIYSSTDVTSSQITGAKKVRGYYFYNILEELDMPGEWYRSGNHLYLWPPSDIKSASIEVSMIEHPVLQISASSNITIRGINFSSCRAVALDIEHSNNILVENCSFLNTGLQAITANYCSNTHVINCQIGHTGSGGITISGGDRVALTPSGNSIKNCEFYDFSRLNKTYTPAVYLSGVGDTLMNCYIHDAADQAILYEGNNHYIAYNHIKNVCYGFFDMGAVYTGRDPSATGTVIYNNYFDNIQNVIGEVAAVYVDDGSGGIIVNQNLFYKSGSGGFGAVHINGGANNKFDNNIFVSCGNAFSHSAWTDEQWKNYYFKNPTNFNKLAYISSGVYQKQYPYLKNFFDTAHLSPRNNFINNTIFYGIKTVSTGSNFITTNSFVAITNPGFANLATQDFRLITVPAQVKLWINWKPVDFSKIGIIK